MKAHSTSRAEMIPLTSVPGVTPERRERPPETASPHAWSAATTVLDAKRVLMSLSRLRPMGWSNQLFGKLVISFSRSSTAWSSAVPFAFRRRMTPLASIT